MNKKSHPKAAPSSLTAKEMDAVRQEALEFAGIGLYRYTFEGTVLFMDKGALRLLDLETRFPDPSAVAGKNVSDLLIYKGPKGTMRERVRKEKHVRDFEHSFRTLSGIDRCVLNDAYLVPDPQSGEEVIQVIARDITNRKQMEAKLKQTNDLLDAERERLAVTLRSIGDGVITTDNDGKIMLINKAAERLTGWSQDEARGRPLGEVFRIIHEKNRQPCENPVRRVIETGLTVGLANHTILIARDGTERIIADSGAPIRDQQSRIIGVVLVFRDVSDKQKMQEELQKASKLESIGILAGGIAHDFNNILTVILGNISLAMMSVDPGDKILHHLVQSEKATMMAKDLTEQLLVFSKGGAPVKSTASLKDLILESATFSIRGSSVKCDFQIAEDLWPAEVDVNQISRVVNNLVLNGTQAMPSGGRLAVHAENAVLGPNRRIPLPPGKYIKISVRDSGIGIPPEHLPKIFDPFFTTKQKGSGLGLSISYSIINKHEGHIMAESQLGKGTAFHIHLPASEKTVLPKPRHAGKPTSGQGRILVMDDEESIRNIATAMLRKLGYEAACVNDGKEAIKTYLAAQKSAHPFHGIIMDLTIPGGVGGREALKTILESDPSARAAASSGYSNDPIMSNFANHGFKAKITKPYTLAEISAVLQELTRPHHP